MSIATKTSTAKPVVSRLTLHRETVRQMLGTDGMDPQAPARVTRAHTCHYHTGGCAKSCNYTHCC